MTENSNVSSKPSSEQKDLSEALNWCKDLIVGWSALKKLRILPLKYFHTVVLICVPALGGAVQILPWSFVQNAIISDSLLLLYASSLCFYIAGLVFDLRCPYIIMNHQSQSEYVEFSINYAQRILSARSEVGEEVRKIEAELRRSKKEGWKQKLVAEIIINKSRIGALSYLDENWRDNDRRRLLWRGVVQFLFIVSFGIGAYLTIWQAPRRVIEVAF